MMVFYPPEVVKAQLEQALARVPAFGMHQGDSLVVTFKIEAGPEDLKVTSGPEIAHTQRITLK